MSDEVTVYDDLGAITLVPKDGGEVWIEPASDQSEEWSFQIGAEESEKHRSLVGGMGYVCLTRAEVIQFIGICQDVLKKNP